MFSLLTDIPEEQRSLIGKVQQCAVEALSTLAPSAVIGDILYGSQDEVERYPGAVAVWMVTLYQTQTGVQLLQSGEGQHFVEAQHFTQMYGGIQFHTALIAQFPEGVLTSTRLETSDGRAWVTSTLQEAQERLTCLTDALAFSDTDELPSWELCERIIVEMYSGLSTLQTLCWQRGTARVAAAQVLNAIPCMFPIGDENGTGVVWMRVEQSRYGASIIAHKQRPGLNLRDDDGGMAAIHIDYYNNRVQVQLYDEEVGPDGCTHWGRVQNPSGESNPLSLHLPPGASECSLILVEDVEHWKRPDEQ